jgi:hypothetical protein
MPSSHNSAWIKSQLTGQQTKQIKPTPKFNILLHSITTCLLSPLLLLCYIHIHLFPWIHTKYKAVEIVITNRKGKTVEIYI